MRYEVTVRNGAARARRGGSSVSPGAVDHVLVWRNHRLAGRSACRQHLAIVKLIIVIRCVAFGHSPCNGNAPNATRIADFSMK